MHKIVSKSLQMCFEHALWRFFRFFLPSVPCRAFQIFWTWKYELSFPDLKIRVQFSDTILKRLSSCIHATVNIRNPISDFLDLKLWDQIRELKNKSSIFWTWKVWIQFPGLKIWGRYLEKTQEKKSKIFQSSKIVQNCSQVSKRVLGLFLGRKFFPTNPWGVESRKIFKKKTFQNSMKAQDRSQKYSNVFWTCFGVIFFE